MPETRSIQHRRDTAANWEAANTVLLSGQFGIETDTQQFKIGDGITAWSALPYSGIRGGGGSQCHNPCLAMAIGGSMASIHASQFALTAYSQTGLTVTVTFLFLNDISTILPAGCPILLSGSQSTPPSLQNLVSHIQTSSWNASTHVYTATFQAKDSATVPLTVTGPSTFMNLFNLSNRGLGGGAGRQAFLHQANDLLGGAFHLPMTAVFGLQGDTLDPATNGPLDAATRLPHAYASLSYRPRILFIANAVDDVIDIADGLRPASAVWDGLMSMLDFCEKNRMLAVYVGYAPGSVLYGAARQPTGLDWNRRLEGYFQQNPHRGIYINPAPSMIDRTSPNGLGKSIFFTGAGIHPNHRGAFAIASCIASRLSNLFTNLPKNVGGGVGDAYNATTNPAGNRIANRGNFTQAMAEAVITTTPNTSAGWSAFRWGGSGGTIKLKTQARTDTDPVTGEAYNGNEAVLTFNDTTSGCSVALVLDGASIVTADLVPGDYYYMQALFEISGASGGQMPLPGLYLSQQHPGGNFYVGRNVNSPSGSGPVTGNRTLLMRTPACPVDVGSTSLSCTLDITAPDGGAGSVAVLKIRDVGIYKSPIQVY